jgi:hypothetical protein
LQRPKARLAVGKRYWDWVNEVEIVGTLPVAETMRRRERFFHEKHTTRAAKIDVFSQAFAHSNMILPTSRALLKWCVAPFLFLSIPRRSVVLAQNETWVEVGSVEASDASQGGEVFGNAVAMSDTTMVVGDSTYDRGKGRAYVYSLLNGNTFKEDVVLFPGETTSRFGWDVAVDGNTIVVAAFNSNAALVFVKDAGEWTLQQKLTSSVAGGGGFGYAVAVDGDRVVVGAYTANGIGAAHVFERSGTTWDETMTLTPSDNLADGWFGFAVDVKGDAIVVGAPNIFARGTVYVFTLLSEVWTETKIQPSDGANNDRFGSSVALSGSSIVVGDLRPNTNGIVYVYDGSAFEETKLIQGDATGNDRLVIRLQSLDIPW